MNAPNVPRIDRNASEPGAAELSRPVAWLADMTAPSESELAEGELLRIFAAAAKTEYEPLVREVAAVLAHHDIHFATHFSTPASRYLKRGVQ